MPGPLAEGPAASAAAGRRETLPTAGYKMTGPPQSPLCGETGQNARLAAKLTGYKIDIKPQSQAE